MNFYKAKCNDFCLKNITGYNILIPTGDQIFKNNSLIVLNDTALFMWRALKSEKNLLELVKSMVSEYEINASEVLDDVDSFLCKLISADALEVRTEEVGFM